MRVTSNQYVEKDAVKCGTKKLCAAVLHTALVDLHAKKAILKELAEEWIDGDSFRPYSFLWVCEVLDMDAEQIREGIKRTTSANIKGTRIQAIADKTRRIQ